MFKRLSPRRRLIAVVVITAVFGALSGTSSASAHAPIYLGTDHTSPDTAAPLGDPASPGLVYGTLTSGSAQYVSFTISGAQPFHAMVLRALRSDSPNPYLAIVGPGLGDPSAAPFTVPDGDGVLFVPPASGAVPIYLADLGLRFIAGSSFDSQLSQDGDYYLVIYGAEGDYTVGTGYGA